MKKLGENITYLFLNIFSINVFGFIFWFLLSFFLGIDDFGKVSYINSLAIFLVNLFSFGIFSALWKYCSENKLDKIFFISFLFSFSISTSLIIFSILFFEQISDLNLLLITLILATLLNFSSYFESILYGFQNFEKIFISNLISSLLKICMILFFLSLFKLNAFSSLISIILSILVGFILKVFFASKYLTSKFSNIIAIDLSEIKRFFSFGLSSFLSNFSSVFFSNFLVIFSFLFVSSIFAGIIYFSQLVYSIISFLPSIIIGASLPLISNLIIKRKLEKSIWITKNLFKISLITILPSTFLVSFYLGDILEFFGMQKEFVQVSPQIFPLVSFSASFFLLSNIFFSFLFSLNKIREIYFIEIICIFLFFFVLFFIDVNYFLISYLFVSVVRFFLYYIVFSSNFLKHFFTIHESTKIIVFVLLSFFIPFAFSRFNFYLKNLKILFSFVLMIFLFKILKIIKNTDKDFIRSLKLHPLIEKIILKLT